MSSIKKLEVEMLAKNVPTRLQPKETDGYKAVIALLCLVVLAMMALAVWLSVGRLNEYNKNVCATYGKQEDCKTPLDLK
jgi:hypothetical protein